MRRAAWLTLIFTACLGDARLKLFESDAPPVAPLDAPDAPPPPANPSDPDVPAPAFKAAPARMHALTALQVQSSLEDLFGTWASTAAPPELDVQQTYASVGSAVVTLTGNTIDKLETLALSVADRTFDDATRRTALLGCTPATPQDPCVRAFISSFGARVWRRPLETAELDALTALSTEVSTAMSDVWQGPRFAVAALLEAPSFLYRVELAPGGRYSDFEMASRLSYALWNSTPDDALLQAAARAELSTPEQVKAQALRMLATPRAEQKARLHFAEYLGSQGLDRLVKDPTVFPAMTPTLGASLRTELDSAIADLALTRRADLRALFRTRDTFVNAEAAGVYGLPAPAVTEPTDVVITGGGINLWGTADSFHFVSRQLVGDGEVVARVDALLGGVDWAKAAVMIREDLTPGARHAISALSPGHGAAFKWRATHDGITAYQPGPAATAPYWVKLTRAGDVLTGLVSADGTTWAQVNQLTLALPQTVFVGVAYTNEDDTKQATAKFSNLKVTGAGNAAWSGRDIGAVAVPGVSTFTAADGWAKATFPSEQRRVGVMGFAGILASQAKVSATSATARGLFVRQRLLCQELPPAPANVDTNLPVPPPNAPRTMRQRMEEHRSNPACASCHKMMDPIGLALENFDGIGRYRTTDQGLPIDASGDIDGVTFDGLDGLMATLDASVTAQRCLARQVYRDATGHVETWDEESVLRDVAAPLGSSGASYFDVLLAVVTSDGFRLASQGSTP